MNAGLIFFLIVIGGIAFLYLYRYPKFGHAVYKYGNQLEAFLYGFKRHKVDVNGIPHAYLHNQCRSKPLLLLIHGFSADKAVWLRMARRFKGDYFVVIPDLAGHGETGFSKDWDYGIKAQAERMLALVSDLGYDKAHVIGNSMGGFIAAHMGRFHQDSVHSITLIDPAGVRAPEQSQMDKMLADGKNPFFVDSRQDFYTFFKMTMAKPPYMPKIILAALADYYQGRKSQLNQISTDFNRREGMLDDEVPQISVPMLLIWGAKDQIIHVSAETIWRRAKSSSSVIWDDLGHMPMLEDPNRTCTAVRHFLSDL